MQDLSKLQEELKQIILTYEEKVSGNRIDNRHQIKQFNALVRNEDISEELINFIIDSTDEINTRHFQFVEHTTKAIKDISDIKHRDIEKLKTILEHSNKKSKKDKDENNSDTEAVWYDFKKWTLTEFKMFAFIIAGILLSIAFIVNANNKEFYTTIKSAIYTFAPLVKPVDNTNNNTTTPQQ